MKNCKGKRGRRRNISRIRSEGRKREKKIPEGVANSLHSKSVQFSPFLVFEERRKKKGGKESRAYDDSFVAVLSNKLLRGVGEKKEKRKALHRPIVKQDRGQPGVGNPGSSEPGGRGNGNGRWPFFGEIQFRRGRRQPSPALKSVCVCVCVCIFYMQSVQKGVKERKKFRADCESWGGEGWSKEGETEGDREAKVLEIRVIENFVTERRYLYNVPRIIFEAEILEARDTSYVTRERIALLKTHLHLNGNYPVWLEQRDRPI